MGSGFPPYVAFFLCRHSFNVLSYFPVNYICSVWTWEIYWKIWQQIWLLQGLRLWLSMNAAGQLQQSAAELKRDIRTTTMGGVLRILLCQYLFSGPHVEVVVTRLFMVIPFQAVVVLHLDSISSLVMKLVYWLQIVNNQGASCVLLYQCKRSNDFPA